jgi:hypothetical protein
VKLVNEQKGFNSMKAVFSCFKGQMEKTNKSLKDGEAKKK